MKWTAEESNVSADRFSTGKTTDGLVDDSLEDGSGEILSGRTFVDERLDICLREYTTACSDRLDRLVIFGVLIQTRCIGL